MLFASTFFVAAALTAAAPAAGVSLTVTPNGPTVLGAQDAVTLHLRVPETAADQRRPLRVAVNVGRCDVPVREKDGSYRVAYSLPTTRHPQVAMIAVWRETGPDAPVEFLRLPLYGRTKVPIRTRKNAVVHVDVGGETFGPVTTNRRGRASVPIFVPPGIDEVFAVVAHRDRRARHRISLDVPPYNRVTLGVTPYLVPADGVSGVTVHAFYDGDADTDRLRVTSTDGTVTRLVSTTHARFGFVPRRGLVGVATVRATVVGDTHSHALATVELGSPRPSNVVAENSDGPLVADGTSERRIVALVTDPAGLGVDGLSPKLTSSAGRVHLGRSLGQGSYEIVLVAPETLPAEEESVVEIRIDELAIRVNVPLSAPAWPASASVALDPPLPTADGDATVAVRVRAVDALGRPLEGAKLVLVDAAATASVAMNDLGNGEYEGVLVPDGERSELSFALSDVDGRFVMQHQAGVRRAPGALEIAAMGGARFDGTFAPTVGVDLRLRPAWLTHRLAFFTTAMFWRISRSVGRSDLDRTLVGSDVDASLNVLPIRVGVSVDAFVGQHWALYAGLGPALLPYASATTVGGIRRTERGVGWGGHAKFGFSMWGIFVEAAGAYTHPLGDEVTVPEFGTDVVAGYRFGVL